MVFPWPATDPASIAMLFEGGPGPESLVAAAAAWAAQAGMQELSAGLSAVNIAGLAPSFVGIGGTASAATGGLLNVLAGTLGGHCIKQQAIVLAALEAYMATRTGLIPSEVVNANRVECANDVAINPLTLGALTPRIAELTGEYAAYWAQNAGLGTTYGATLNTLTAALTTAPPPATLGANPAAPALMTGSVAESAATNTAGAATRAAGQVATQGGGMGGFEQVLGTATQSMTGMLQPAMGMFTSVPQSLQGLMSLPQSMLGSMGSMFGGMGGAQSAGLDGAPRAFEAARAVPAGLSSGAGGVGGGGIGAGGGGSANPGLTSYTRPTGAFEPNGGRATGLKSGLLNAAEVRSGPVSGGGTGAPMSPAAGMLGRGQGGENKHEVAHARIVVDGVVPEDDRHQV
jgi:hypothetical protein